MTLRAIAGFAIALAALSRAEIIDRVAVTVGNRVITSSEIEREARLTAFLNNTQPDLSLAGRRKTAERLVEQRLVKRELEAARYPAPTESEVQAALNEVKARYASTAAWQEALRKYSITEQDVRDHLAWQLAFLRFIDIRFRPGVQVSDEDVKQYFEKTVRPVAEQAHPGTAPTLDEYREKIEETLVGQRVDQEVDRWLQAARRRNQVEYREGAFQ